MMKRTSVKQIEPVVEFESCSVDRDGNVLRGPIDNYIVPISSILFLRKGYMCNHYYVHFKNSDKVLIKKSTYERINEILKEHSTNYINIVHEQDNT